MKIFCLYFLLFFTVFNVNTGFLMGNGIEVVRGNWFTSWRFSDELHSLNEKMTSYVMSLDDAKKYITLGGRLDYCSNYGILRQFFVGSTMTPILNYFIGPNATAANPQRLEILKLFLESGSDPNQINGSDSVVNTSIAPINFAAAHNDIEALKVLLAFHPNLNLIEEKYTGIKGPALALTSSVEVADLLKSAGADPHGVRFDGSTLLHVHAQSKEMTVPLKELMIWLIKQRVDIDAKNRDGKTAADLVRQNMEVRKVYLKEDATLGSVGQTSALDQTKLSQEVLNLLSK